MLFFAYILKCFKSDGSYKYYKGSTDNVFRRFEEHVDQLNRYTKRFKGNVMLVYFEIFPTRSKAMKREKELKDTSREEVEKLIWL